MKVRLDFVSNSSSSSYVIACDAAIASNVMKKIARMCVDKDAYGHNPCLFNRNYRILDFCTNHFQLLFLGTLCIETKKKKYSIETFKSLYRSNSVNAAVEFERYKENVEKASKLASRKNSTANGSFDDNWICKEYGRDKKIDANSYWHYYDNEVEGIVVSSEQMEYGFDRFHYDGDSTKESKSTFDTRIEAIVATAKRKFDDDRQRDLKDLVGTIAVYEITEDTLLNTRDLIKAGYKVTLDKHEDIDVMQKLIDNGNRIFHIRVAHDGDGYGDFHIYEESGSMYLSDIEGVECLAGFSE